MSSGKVENGLKNSEVRSRLGGCCSGPVKGPRLWQGLWGWRKVVGDWLERYKWQNIKNLVTDSMSGVRDKKNKGSARVSGTESWYREAPFTEMRTAEQRTDMITVILQWERSVGRKQDGSQENELSSYCSGPGELRGPGLRWAVILEGKLRNSRQGWQLQWRVLENRIKQLH